ncbi:hypothetical protein LXL04_036664 [Taraxacum kok-saghyz]
MFPDFRRDLKVLPSTMPNIKSFRAFEKYNPAEGNKPGHVGLKEGRSEGKASPGRKEGRGRVVGHVGLKSRLAAEQQPSRRLGAAPRGAVCRSRTSSGQWRTRRRQVGRWEVRTEEESGSRRRQEERKEARQSRFEIVKELIPCNLKEMYLIMKFLVLLMCVHVVRGSVACVEQKPFFIVPTHVDIRTVGCILLALVTVCFAPMLIRRMYSKVGTTNEEQMETSCFVQ